MHLVAVLEDGEVSIWKCCKYTGGSFTLHASVKVDHKIHELLQIPLRNTFILTGRDRSTVAYYRYDDSELVTSSLNYACKSCCWSSYHDCLIMLSDGDDDDLRLLLFKVSSNEVIFLSDIMFKSTPGRPRKMSAIGKYIFCTFDAPLEEDIKIKVGASHADEDVAMPTNKFDNNNLYNLLNYATQPASSSSKSSPMLEVFELEQSSSKPSSFKEICSKSLGNTIIPDLVIADEPACERFIVIVGSLKCSSLSSFIFDSKKTTINLMGRTDFQGQEVRGVCITPQGQLLCMTSESSASGPFSFLNFDKSDETIRLRIHSSPNVVTSIHQSGRKGHANHRHRVNLKDENMHSDDEDDDDEDDCNNYVPDGSDRILQVVQPKIQNKMVEEFVNDDDDDDNDDDDDDDDVVELRETQLKSAYTCADCGSTRAVHRSYSSLGVTSRGSCHGDLEKLVASAVEKELKKFRSELLKEIKVLLGK